jgi:hypothetical protein
MWGSLAGISDLLTTCFERGLIFAWRINIEEAPPLVVI